MMFRGKIASFLAPYLPTADASRITFYGHLCSFGAALLYVIPFELVGLGWLKRPMFMLSFWAHLMTSMLLIKDRYPLPALQLTSYSLAAVKQVFETRVAPWLQRAMQSPDFHFLFFSVIFLSAYPSVLPLVILGRRSFWAVCQEAPKKTPNNFLWLKFQPTWKAKFEP